jgi:hypothetical protein
MSTSYVQHPGGSSKDFFRDTANQLPNGTNDNTKDIYRSGSVGINATPVSSFDLLGTLGLAISTFTTSYTAGAFDFTLVKTSASVAVLTLPAANSAPRRVYRVINRGSVALTTTAFLDRFGVFRTSLSPFETVELHSDGNNWIAISQTSSQPFFIQQTFVANTATVITHGLNRTNTSNIQVSVVDSVTGDQVSVRLTAYTATTVSITSPVALTNANVTIQ